MMKKTLWRCAAVAATVACLAGVPAFSAEEPKNEFGVLSGFAFGDKTMVGDGKHDEPNLILGLRYGHMFESGKVAFFGDFTNVGYNGVTSIGDVDARALRFGLEWLFAPEKTNRWFFSTGAGIVEFSPAVGSDFNRGIASLGFGRRYQQTEKFSFRWELRGEHTLTGDSGLGGQDVTNAQLLLGWMWGSPSTPKDDDGDGVPNRRDQCPNTPSGCIVDEKGCERDSDGDGVCDGIDKCPGTAAGTPVDASGCPKDADGDGVHDGIDKCPATPKGCKVDASGCPVDSDNDGVCDGLDKCADTPKGCKVDASGCPVDSDKDGVCDGLDTCAHTPAGKKVDADGCPLPEKAAPLFTPEDSPTKALVLEGVNFEYDSAKLTGDSSTVLDKVAASLKDWPEIKVEIGGHTDSRGSDAYNMKLSLRRAESVRDYLVSAGVPASQLTVKGYGESKPIGDNTTDAGRAKNRRVELTRVR